MKVPKPRYNAALIAQDLAERGWHGEELARRAGLSGSTVHRFLTGQMQTGKAAAKIADALGYPLKRYVLPVKTRSVA
jgi:transcriptional regulator with XRE-family HTH domain